MPSIGQTWVLASIGAVIEMGILSRKPILSKICITADVQENVILHYKTFYFGKTCATT
jgi:hypothetical protein